MRGKLRRLLAVGGSAFALVLAGKYGGVAQAETAERIDLNGHDVISEKEANFSMMSYYGGPEDALNNYACEKVRERFPNVTLSLEAHHQDGGTILKARAATGDLPDIVQVDSGSLKPLIASGSILQLDEYITRTGYREVLTKGAEQTGLYSPDGHIYQFPLGGVSPTLWYYNRRLFAENDVKVPENYEELLTAVRKLREKKRIPFALFAKEPWPGGAIFDSFLLKEDPSGIYGMSEGKTDPQDIARAAEKLETLVSAGMFQEGCTQMNFDEASALFAGGSCAMFLNGSWYLTSAEEALGEDLGIFETYPTADRGKETVNALAMSGGGDTCGLAVSAGTEDPELAALVAAVYAYHREIAEYRIDRSITVPVITEGIDTLQPLSDAARWLGEQLPLYSYRSKYVHTLSNTRFASLFTLQIQKLLSGGSADEFVRALADAGQAE